MTVIPLCKIGIKQSRVQIPLKFQESIFSKVDMVFNLLSDLQFLKLTFSSPEALIRKAPGPWCPLAVALDGWLLHWRTSSYSDLPVWNS